MDLVNEIKRELNDIAERDNTGSSLSIPEWTGLVKEALTKLGKQQDYFVYVSRAKESDGGEFIYDLCWMDYDGDSLRDVPLIMECEWGGKDYIYEDFQKLIIGRARWRVMIFSSKTGVDLGERVDRLKKYVRDFSLSSSKDRYLLCAWRGDTKRFEYFELPA